MYLIHILQYMLKKCVCFEIFSANFRCELVCPRRACCVFYEDTNVYNGMGMTGITRRRGFMRTFSVSQ